jgi:hypothetical protein
LAFRARAPWAGEESYIKGVKPLGANRARAERVSAVRRAAS